MLGAVNGGPTSTMGSMAPDGPPPYGRFERLLGSMSPPPGTHWRQGLLMETEPSYTKVGGATIVAVNGIAGPTLTGTTISVSNNNRLSQPQVVRQRYQSELSAYGGTSASYFEAKDQFDE